MECWAVARKDEMFNSGLASHFRSIPSFCLRKNTNFSIAAVACQLLKNHEIIAKSPAAKLPRCPSPNAWQEAQYLLHGASLHIGSFPQY